MKSIPLVRVYTLLPWIALLRERGAPVERWLASVKLPTAIGDYPQALIPVRQVGCFFEQAARAEGIELGLIVGQRARLRELGDFGRLVCGSVTLHEAIATAARLIAAHDSSERIWLKTQGEQAWLCHRFITRIDHGRQQADQHVLMYLLQLIRLAAGAEWRPREVHLAIRPTPRLDRFEPLAEARLICDQGVTAVRLPRALLSRPLKETTPLAAPTEAESALWLSAPAGDFVGSMRQALELLLQEGYPPIELAAEIAGRSIRTFQRQLALNGLSYSRLIERARFDRAVELLTDPRVKLVEIALELGYTEAANFTRAFRRWTGVAPGVFRRMRRSG